MKLTPWLCLAGILALPPLLFAAAVPTNPTFTWTNPITAGLPGYGQKDFHILKDGATWYLVATEMPVPAQGKRGLVLYASENLTQWREAAVLFDREKLPADAWYRDEWTAPELHKIGGKYYATFNNRNNRLRPYKKYGFGIAVADRIEGPYRILNPERPLFHGSNTTLLEDTNGKTYLYWDVDGRIWAAECDVARAALLGEPREILGPDTLGKQFRFLDAPCVTKRGDTYYLVTSSFYAGYIIRVRTSTAPGPLGPWTMAAEPLMSFIESEADTKLKMPYPSGYSFAPPTQVIFHHQIFTGPGGKDFIAYHSSEKYSEPYLVIESVEFDGRGGLKVINNKAPQQSVSLP